MTFSGCLELSESTACCQKSRIDRIVALCLLLKRASYPYRCKDMILLFGRNPIELYLIFTLYFTAAIFTEICTYSSRKRSPLYNCFNFVDGTIARIFKTVLNERAVYSRHARVNCVKCLGDFAKWLDYQP